MRLNPLQHHTSDGLSLRPFFVMVPLLCLQTPNSLFLHLLIGSVCIEENRRNLLSMWIASSGRGPHEAYSKGRKIIWFRLQSGEGLKNHHCLSSTREFGWLLVLAYTWWASLVYLSSPWLKHTVSMLIFFLCWVLAWDAFFPLQEGIWGPQF